MKTKKTLLYFFLDLIDARKDYRKCHAIISDNEFLLSLAKAKRIDERYLMYAVDDLIGSADLTPSASDAVHRELSKHEMYTIKELIRLVYKYQK